jgi:hypothetical protein
VSGLYPQTLTNELARKFINQLCSGNNIDLMIDAKTLIVTNRLGIEYDNVQNKSLISYELATEIKKLFLVDSSQFIFSIEKISDTIDELKLSVPSKGYTTQYYFTDSKYTHPVLVFTNDWSVTESKYFEFLVQDKSLTNEYAIKKLDDFVEQTGKLFQFSEEDFSMLEKEKIYYVLCDGEDEVEKLTGYKVRGMYNLAGDMIVTTYNSHYHELVHLLVNYKLKKLPLYTHSFLQEGIAVALGGRGGLSPSSLLYIASFLETSGFFSYKEILKNSDFKMNDASITYPVSGFYNSFLLQQLGAEKYFELYRKYSSDGSSINETEIDSGFLPSESEWKSYQQSYVNPISIVNNNSDDRKVYLEGDYYYFNLNEPLFIKTEELSDYQSKLFKELFPRSNYKGEKYGIIPKEKEITVYNFFTNNIEASYSTGFSIEQQNLKNENGYWCFKVKADLFDQSIEDSIAK